MNVTRRVSRQCGSGSVARVTRTMRSRSLHLPYRGNKFMVIGHAKSRLVPAGGAWSYAYIENSKDAEDDTGTGSAGQKTGADLRAHVPHGPMVAVAARGSDPADDLGPARHGARFHAPLSLRTSVPLPDPVLLAVRQRRMRAGIEQPGSLDPGGAADHPVRLRVAGVRPRL